MGCTAPGSLVRNGPRNRKVVALTFDDGPSTYTAGFLDVLRSKQVRGTFYVLGQNAAANPVLSRRIVSEGHEIANHSWKHDLYPGHADLSQTSATIRNLTGFTPCTFRPPGGAQNPGVVSGAARAGMTTVLWDVDPFDWRLPGAESVYRTIVNGVRPNDTEVVDKFAESMFKAGSFDRLISFLQLRAEDTRQVDDYLRLGWYAVETGDADLAQRALLTAARLDGGRSVQPHLALADFYLAAGDRGKAMRRLRMALGVDPEHEIVKSKIRAMGEIPGPSFALTPDED